MHVKTYKIFYLVITSLLIALFFSSCTSRSGQLSRHRERLEFTTYEVYVPNSAIIGQSRSRVVYAYKGDTLMTDAKTTHSVFDGAGREIGFTTRVYK